MKRGKFLRLLAAGAAAVPAAAMAGSIAEKAPIVPVVDEDIVHCDKGIFHILTGEEGYNAFQEVSREYYISQIEQGDIRYYKSRRKRG